MLRNKKAQTATEFAILGSLIIVAFSFLINYSEKLNRQQSYIQQTFRQALKESRGANTSASYTRVVMRRMANVASPMELGQVQSFSSSANVLWANGKNKDEHGVSKYQLNEAAAIDVPYRESPGQGEMETSTNVFTNTAVSETGLRKRESSGNIVTDKWLTATDTLQADVNVGGTAYSFTHNLGEGGKYYPDATTLRRSGSMQ